MHHAAVQQHDGADRPAQLGARASRFPRAGQGFATPSGKLEFYSETLGGRGLPPMPDRVADPSDQELARRWPLRLLTAPGYHQAHTTYSGVAWLRRRQGEPECV